MTRFATGGLRPPRMRPPRLSRLLGFSGGVRFHLSYRWEDQLQAIEDIYAKINYRYLVILGGTLRNWVIKAFKYEADIDTHSTPGSPPFLHQPGKGFVRGGLAYHIDRLEGSVIFGARHDRMGLWGWKHEYGRPFGGANYPPRQFILPQYLRLQAIREILYNHAIRAVKAQALVKGRIGKM